VPRTAQIKECCRILRLVNCEDSQVREILGQVAGFLEGYGAQEQEERKEWQSRLQERDRKVLNLESELKYLKADAIRKRPAITTDLKLSALDDNGFLLSNMREND